MYNELPTITDSTPAQRLQALKDARDLVAGEAPKSGLVAAFGSDAPKGAGATSAEALIRLAEYITTGHDYADTHPTGDMFSEALALEKFRDKQVRKNHKAFVEDHAGHGGHEHLLGAFPVPAHIAEKLLSGDFDPRDIIKLMREYSETPKDDETPNEG
ncbi:hypothetical protein FDH86_gp053 [Arthrobacter phage Tank]|uniref:Uncharacterized protein n=1 Tax=Arthrobacter phage Tank TaxID=1772319 RepID=A0A0U4K3I7_9CAUD|nr:hypothetical protein FDH86_gp053 [Arthrobacter phage Tank]ALY10588.1 hypothetical protein TANK_53 [Arthrobacter phage Tank]